MDADTHEESSNPVLHFRRGWHLVGHKDNSDDDYPSKFADELDKIRTEFGLSASDISIDDMARCLILTIGTLAKLHPGNRKSLVKRLMLRFERQVRTWNQDDSSDPNVWETSEILHRRGGILSHPNVIKNLKRENRWDPCVV